MDLINLKRHFETIFQDHGYDVWFGSKASYNRKRKISNREIIVEPFNLKLEPDNECDYDLDLTFWVGLRRDVNASFTTPDGDDVDFMNYHLGEVEKIYNSIESNNNILVKAKKKDIVLRYYEADGSQTVNTQSFIRFTIPMKLYGI